VTAGTLSGVNLGALAQLEEHLLCKQRVRGSSPLSSTPVLSGLGWRLGWLFGQCAAGTALAPIQITGAPDVIGIAPDGKTAYALDGSSATVTPILTATKTALTPIKVGCQPQSIAIAS
jgi:DNA-binding beta-propeller fold protein YncE